MKPVRELDAANLHVQLDEREVETGLLFAGTAPPLDSTLTNAKVVEQLAFSLAWHYALDIRDDAEVYICERSLRIY